MLIERRFWEAGLRTEKSGSEGESEKSGRKVSR